MNTMLMVFLVLLQTSCSASGAKILLIPGPGTSLCLQMMSFGEELLKRGHHVTLYALFFDPQQCISRGNTDSYKTRFKTMIPKLDVVHEKTNEENKLKYANYIFNQKHYFYILLYGLNPLVENFCDSALYDKDVLIELKEDRYDLALVEAMPFTSCLFAVPLHLGIPYGAVGSFIDPQDSRMPLQTNIFPSLYTGYTNEMTYIQRLFNTVFFLMNPVIRHFMRPSMDLSTYSNTLAGYDSRDLIKDSVLFLENSDYIVDYPKALFPNFIQVGGLTAGPARPLQHVFQEFMDNSEEGVVLVTFGSMIQEIPSYIKEKLMTAFGRLKLSVLFKYNKEFTQENIKVLKWVPQNDILAHQNTKLFISHCGKNGLWEGVYHGVPIICMSIHGETHATKVKVKKYGIGSSINMFEDTVDEIVEEVNNVLNNESIYRNMMVMSTLFRDRPQTPRERAASAIEHVIKYGGEHMRPPSVDFDFLSYTSIDVLFTIFFFHVLIIIVCLWLLQKCCSNLKIGKRKTD